MYQLYSLPGTCAVATQVILRELEQDFDVISRDSEADYHEINPVGVVPALKTDDTVITEGVAILLHLLEEHPNTLMPSKGTPTYTQAIENMLFANATMHPAYSRLFFINAQDLQDGIKQQLLNAAAADISKLWCVVEKKLENNPEGACFLSGNRHSPADILLTVYASWGDYFPITIEIGPKATRMLEATGKLPTFFDTLDTQ